MTGYPRVTLRDFTIGPGTGYEIVDDGIDGLGTPPLRTHDVTRGHASFSVAANDYRDIRIITIPVEVAADSVDDAWANAQVLVDAWAEADEDLTLTIQLSRRTGLAYTGRPGASGQSPCELHLAELYSDHTIVAVLAFRVLAEVDDT